jgi:hypothetical protein
MTDILKKNLAFIEQYNPNLCKKVLAFDNFAKKVELSVDKNGAYNLIVNGLAVHSADGVLDEAKVVFDKLPHNSGNSIHVIYGLGLGYLYDEFVGKTKGTIIVYEPDIELLRYVMEIVDFTENFSKSKTFFVSSLDEFKIIFETTFKYLSKTSLSALNYHILNDLTSYKSFKEYLENLFGLVSHNYAFQINSIYMFLVHIISGMDKKLNSMLLTDYPDIFKDKPAVVVSAGPSLAKNIEYLKKYRDNVFIFCVGTALKTLLANGIVPDFLHVIEKADTSVHINVPETKDMYLVCEPYVNEAILKFPYKGVLVTASEETDAARWFLSKRGNELVPFETKGTVAYHALYTAKYFGCNPIILIGQDLAYSDGNCYAKGSAFEDLECIFDDEKQKYIVKPSNYEQFRDAYYHSPVLTIEQKDTMMAKTLKELNDNLVTVDGQDGKKLPTSRVYSLFIEYIKDFAQRHNDKLKLINASLGGAKIDGLELMSLEDSFKNYATNSINKDFLFKQFYELKKDINIAQIIDSLQADIDSAKDMLPLFEEGQFLVSKLRKELFNIRYYSPKAEIFMSKLSKHYVHIVNNYAVKSRFLSIIIAKEHQDLGYLMKELDIMDYNMAKEFLSAFHMFFSASDKINDIVGIMEVVISNLKEQNESSIAKS